MKKNTQLGETGLGCSGCTSSINGILVQQLQFYNASKRQNPISNGECVWTRLMGAH